MSKLHQNLELHLKAWPMWFRSCNGSSFFSNPMSSTDSDGRPGRVFQEDGFLVFRKKRSKLLKTTMHRSLQKSAPPKTETPRKTPQDQLWPTRSRKNRWLLFVLTIDRGLQENGSGRGGGHRHRVALTAALCQKIAYQLHVCEESLRHSIRFHPLAHRASLHGALKAALAYGGWSLVDASYKALEGPLKISPSPAGNQ